MDSKSVKELKRHLFFTIIFMNRSQLTSFNMYTDSVSQIANISNIFSENSYDFHELQFYTDFVTLQTRFSILKNVSIDLKLELKWHVGI